MCLTLTLAGAQLVLWKSATTKSRRDNINIVFESRQMTSKLHEFHLSLLRKDFSPVQSARALGIKHLITI